MPQGQKEIRQTRVATMADLDLDPVFAADGPDDTMNVALSLLAQKVQLLGMYPLLTGEVGVTDKTYAWGHAFRYGILNDGTLVKTQVQNLLTTIAAVSSIRYILFPKGSYGVGNLTIASPSCFSINNVNDLVIDAYGAEFICNTTENTTSQIFVFNDCQGIVVRGLKGSDTGYDPTITWRGATLLYFQNLTQAVGYLTGYRLVDITARNMVSPLTFAGTAGARMRDIQFTVFCDNCYYGPNFQNNGDDVRGYAYVFKPRRAYFPYGVKDHDIRLRIEDDGTGQGSNCCIPIDRQAPEMNINARNTTGIKVHASFGGTAMWQVLVSCKFQHVTATPSVATMVIDDIDLTINTDDGMTITGGSFIYAQVDEDSVTGAASATTLAKWGRIKLSGNAFNNSATSVNFPTIQAVEGELTLDPSISYNNQTGPIWGGMAVKLTHNTYLRGIKGNLTTQTIKIPLLGFNGGYPFMIKCTVSAEDGGAGARNNRWRELLLEGFVSGGAVGLVATILATVDVGVPPGIVFTPTGTDIVVSFTGAGFVGAACYAQVVTQFNKLPKRA